MNGLAFGTDRKAEAGSIPAPVASDVSDLIVFGSWKAGSVIAIGLADYYEGERLSLSTFFLPPVTPPNPTNHHDRSDPNHIG